MPITAPAASRSQACCCEAAQAWDVALSASVMVGDRWSDVEAGRAAGCKSILIERAYSGREHCQPDWVVR